MTERPLRVLLTGHRGWLGWWLHRYLRAAGHRVIGFDIRDGDDIRDRAKLCAAATTADIVVHCATLGFDWPGPDHVLRDVNLDGALNALEAARQARHPRIIVFSSAQVFGIMRGERLPVSFPVHDSHPLLAERPYGMLKAELEQACERFANESGVTVFCPRPVHIMVPGQPADVRRRWKETPEREFAPFWEYGAWVDIRDVCEAVRLALTAPSPPFSGAILAAADIAASCPTVEAVARAAPEVPLAKGWLDTQGDHAPLFDSSLANELLGWEPRHTWAVESRLSLAQRAWNRLQRVPAYGPAIRREPR